MEAMKKVPNISPKKHPKTENNQLLFWAIAFESPDCQGWFASLAFLHTTAVWHYYQYKHLAFCAFQENLTDKILLVFVFT